MTLTNEEMIEARDKAYKKAGHNAYFSNGFYAGAKWAASKMEQADRFDPCCMKCGNPLLSEELVCKECCNPEEARQCKIIEEIDDTWADHAEVYYKCGNCMEYKREEDLHRIKFCSNCGYKFIKGE